VEISDGARIKCNYELCVKVVNKSNIQSTTSSRVTLIHVIIFLLNVLVLVNKVKIRYVPLVHEW
jgi:hypothetical protein